MPHTLRTTIGDDDEFVIVASDGLFDVVTPDEVKKTKINYNQRRK